MWKSAKKSHVNNTTSIMFNIFIFLGIIHTFNNIFSPLEKNIRRCLGIAMNVMCIEVFNKRNLIGDCPQSLSNLKHFTLPMLTLLSSKAQECKDF